MHHVLFVCTGNYYRSRFAEALFNHHASVEKKPMQAFSRGLAIHLAEGDLSPYTVAALSERGIDRMHTGPTRSALQEDDLRLADTIVLLDEIEHRPYMESLFPDWAEHVRYWNCRDVQWEASTACLPKVETRVLALLKELSPQRAKRIQR